NLLVPRGAAGGLYRPVFQMQFRRGRSGAAVGCRLASPQPKFDGPRAYASFRSSFPVPKAPSPVTDRDIAPLLRSIADALERLAPPPQAPVNLDSADAFVWHADSRRLQAVAEVNRVALPLLRGIDQSRDILLENTRRF